MADFGQSYFDPHHPPPDPLPPDRPKFRFSPSPAAIFALSCLSRGSFRGILVVFFEGQGTGFERS